MKVTAEKIPQSKVLLRIELSPEQVQEAIEKTYRDLSRRIRVPGFRPGKAPRSLVERYVGGPQTIQEEGVERLIDDSFRKALREADVHPIGEADVSERPEYHPGEPLVFEAAVPVAPTVELGDYQSVHMQPIAVEATSEQVNRFIDDLVEANAEWTPVDRGAREGDHVTIDVQGTVGTVPTLFGPSGETLLHSPGGREVYNDKDHEHLINTKEPPEYAPGFDEEIVGMMSGSERTFGLTLPVEFPDAALANQSIVFTVKLHEVKEKHLPELNDEFAKTVAGGETLGELRDNARQRIQSRMEYEARLAFENSLVEAVVERSTIEVPDVMVERQIDSRIEDLKADFARQKVDWQDYLAQAHQTEAQVRDEMREGALRGLRDSLVLREVAQRENIVVEPEEVTADIDATAAQFGAASNIIRDRLNTRDQREQIEGRLLYRKTVARLAEFAAQPAEPETPTESEGTATETNEASTSPSESTAPEGAIAAAPVEAEPASEQPEPAPASEPASTTEETS
ncbi:MAG: trigger factor [Chloroflexota bacterium]